MGGGWWLPDSVARAMLTTALLMMLATADAPRSMRLVADEVPQLPAYTGWGRAQLKVEYERLSDERPGVGLPISLMASGGAGLTLSLYVLSSFLPTGVRGSNVPIAVVFALLGTTSAGLVALGAILLSRILPERRVYSAKMDEVAAQLKELEEVDRRYDRDRAPVYVPPPPEPPIIGPPPVGPPPLPLPPMPQASLTFPLFLARF